MLFYKANAEYCDFLRTKDPCVPYTMDRKANRPFIGVVFKINNIEYYAPLSSPKPKHKTMKNQKDFLKINNGEWGAINLNNMIPIHIESLKLIDMTITANDNLNDKQYKSLLLNQQIWCKENKDSILTKSKNLYNEIISNKAPINLKNRCCNFALDEQMYLKYCQENNLQIEVQNKLENILKKKPIL